MSNDKPKFPETTEQISKMLNIDHNVQTSWSQPAKAPEPADLPVIDLPITDLPTGATVAVADVPVANSESEVKASAKDEVKKSETKAEPQSKSQSISTPPSAKAWRIAKTVAPYVVVAAIAVGLYYFYNSDFSWSSLFKSNSSTQVASNSQANAALSTLKKQETAGYNAWIQQFFYSVNDANIISMDADVSGNGLTNFQKYLLNLNPKIYDTVGNGSSDGQKIIDGINPWTGQPLNDDQKSLVDNYFDKELISNRIAAAQANHTNALYAPYVASGSPYYQAGVSNSNSQAVAQEQTVPSNGQVAGATTTVPAQNSVPQTQPQTQPQVQPYRTAPLTGVNNDAGASKPLGSGVVDTTIPGRLDIPSAKISAPLIWSQDPNSFETDLQNGVIHYTGTPLPGEVGTSYISGHSSGYFWDHSKYKEIFSHLGDVKDGTSFTITETLVGGKQVILHYVIGGRAQYQADDQRQFVQTAQSVVALSTCWPVNTTARRLVLYGTLTQIEN